MKETDLKPRINLESQPEDEMRLRRRQVYQAECRRETHLRGEWRYEKNKETMHQVKETFKKDEAEKKTKDSGRQDKDVKRHTTRLKVYVFICLTLTNEVSEMSVSSNENRPLCARVKLSRIELL